MRDATEAIADALRRAERPCVTSSFQAEDVVLIHLLREAMPQIPVLFIDTLHHFPETLEYRDRITEQWKLNRIDIRASSPRPGLWTSTTDGCCALHKVGPLFEALTPYDTWFTGLRRQQSPSRADLAHSASFRLPTGQVLDKVSPLAAWTMRDVQAYASVNEIPLLPLYDRGYTSIGCAPCTSPPQDPENPRSGRWNGSRLECGIHIEGTPVTRDRHPERSEG